MNTRFLQEPKVGEAISRILNVECEEKLFFFKYCKVIRFCRCHCKLQAKKWKESDDHLRYEPRKANDTLQMNPYYPNLQNKVEECKQGLLEFEQCIVESQEVRSRTKWREKRDTMTKEWDLEYVVRAMAKGNAPSPNEVVIEFFLHYWHIIRGEG